MGDEQIPNSVSELKSMDIVFAWIPQLKDLISGTWFQCKKVFKYTVSFFMQQSRHVFSVLSGY